MFVKINLTLPTLLVLTRWQGGRQARGAATLGGPKEWKWGAGQEKVPAKTGDHISFCRPLRSEAKKPYFAPQKEMCGKSLPPGISLGVPTHLRDVSSLGSSEIGHKHLSSHHSPRKLNLVNTTFYQVFKPMCANGRNLPQNSAKIRGTDGAPLLRRESPAEGSLHTYTLSSFATRDNSSGNLWCGSCEPPLHGSGGCEQTSLGRQEQRQSAAGPQQAACGDGFHLRQMMAVCSSEKKNPKQIKCMSPAILNLTSTLFIFPSGFIPL